MYSSSMIDECLGCCMEIEKRRTLASRKEKPQVNNQLDSTDSNGSLSTLNQEKEKGSFLKVKKVTSDVQIPVQQSSQAIGLDLYANQAAMISANQRQLVGTGIAVEIPQGHYLRIALRSGLSIKNSIDIGAGVIDPDYRGKIKVLLINITTKTS